MQPQDDKDLERILQVAGRRPQPPDDFRNEMRRALHAEWRKVIDDRHSRRSRWIRFAAAASIMVLATSLWIAREQAFGSSQRVGAIERLTGVVRLDRGWLVPERQIVAHADVAVHDELSTGPSSGVALLLEDATQVRLDGNTRIAIPSRSQIRLLSGAAYVDARPRTADPGSVLKIATPFGTVRHLGTQYEIRVARSDLQLTVREGRVELTALDGGVQTVRSGERLKLDAAGVLQRSSIAPNAPDWYWTSALAVPFSLDNRPLADFLDWVARELGRTLEYDSPQSESAARRTLMRGSVATLPPDAALTAVLATTQLRSHDDGRRILIAIDNS
jgi:ferric-dicitrate binding protein FerR (iron transport regulator)